MLKAKLINNGHIDIDKNRIYSPLKIKSSDSYKWLEATVTESPSGVNTVIEVINEQEIQLGWDLLKQNEYIEIEALVEVIGELDKDGEKGTDFYNDLSFDYRITDLNSIQKEREVTEVIRDRALINRFGKTLGIISILLGLIFLFIEFFTPLNFMDKQVVKYIIENNNSEIKSIISINCKSDKIILNIEGENKEREISVKEFNQNYIIKRIEKITSDPVNSYFNKVIGSTYVLLGFLLLVVQRIRKRTKHKLS